MKCIDYQTELIIKFLRETRENEFQQYVMGFNKHDDLEGDRKRSELFEFGKRVLFAKENQHSLERIFPPSIWTVLSRFLFNKNKPTEVEDPHLADFIDPKTKEIYKVRIHKLLPLD